LRVLWPKTNIEANHFLERQIALGDLEQTKDAIMLRIKAIESAKSLLEYPIKKPQTLDMCADIFQFARYFCPASVTHLLIWRIVDSSETLDVVLSDRAMTHLIESMRRSPRLVSKIITEIFETDCEGTIDIMSSLLRRVFRTYVEPIFLVVPTDFLSNIRDILVPNPFGLRITRVEVFVRCATVAAQHSSASRIAFIEAGIEEHLLFLLSDASISTSPSQVIRSFHDAESIRKRGVAHLFNNSEQITSLQSRIFQEAFRIFFQTPDPQVVLQNDIFWNHPRRSVSG
jgi:hypothetical protein